MKRHQVLSALLGLFLISFSPWTLSSDGWESLGETKNVKGYVKAVPGSSLKAFKGVMIMDVSIKKIWWVLTNYDNDFRKEWVDRLQVSKELELLGSAERITYQSFDLPWPISDRDYVYHSKAEMQGENIYISIKSTKHSKAPETVGVRAQLNQSKYLLEPLGDNKTRVTVEIHTDPKGLLPAWLVNLIQKGWPVKTLNNLKTQTAKYNGQDIKLPGK